MKKTIKILMVSVLLLSGGIYGLLNLKTTTTMAINFQSKDYEIPVYLKILDFYSRHFHYKYLVKNVTQDYEQQREKILALAKWVNLNIKRTPDGVDVVDNHPLTIVERRLGLPEQFSDLLSVLLVYSGSQSFFKRINLKSIYLFYEGNRYPLTFFKNEGSWSVMDPYQGFYFVNIDGDFASISDLQDKRWYIKTFENEEANKQEMLGFYSDLFSSLPTDEEINGTDIYKRGGRANSQHPSGRFAYEIHKILRFK